MYGFVYPAGYPAFYPGAPAAAVLAPAEADDSEEEERPTKKKRRKGEDVVGFGYGASKASEKKEKKSGSSSSSSWPEGLAVSGCKDKTVKKIVRGNFTLMGENHGRPTYKRDEPFNDLDVMIYYWDDRDGKDFSGWWFGPKVGGDQVWAYQPVKDKTPPLSGWKVPYDGSVDKSLVIKHQATKKASTVAAHAVQVPGQPFFYMPGMPGMPGMPVMPGMEAVPFVDPFAAERARQEEVRRRMAEEEERRRKEAQRQAEEMRKKREEEMRKKQEEMKKAKELAEQRMREGKSVFLIRKVTAKFSMATPENFETLQKELEEVLNKELEACGSQKAQLQIESGNCIEQAKKRIEILAEAKRKAQEKKEEEERKRQEQLSKAKALLGEIGILIGKAEGALERLKEAAAPLEGEPAEGESHSLEKIELHAFNVEAAGTEAKALTKACSDFLLANNNDMKEPPALMVPGAQTQTSEIKTTLTALLGRMNECSRSTDSLLASTRSIKTTAVRRASATKKTSELEESFAKYDKDGDKVLSKAEVTAFASAEYKLSLSEEVFSKIWKCAVDDDQPGVTFARFHFLKMKLGSEHELARDRQRKAARIAREKVRAILRGKLDKKVLTIEPHIEAVEKAVIAAEKAVPPLLCKARDEMADMALMEQILSTRCLIEAATAAAASAQAKIEQLVEGFDAKHSTDIKELTVPDYRIFAKKMGRFDLRLRRSEKLCTRFQCEVMKKRMAELYAIRHFATKVARQHARLKGLSIEDLFGELDANKDGKIDEKEFLKFFAGVDKEIKEDFEGKAEGEGEQAPGTKVEEPKKEQAKVELTNDAVSSLFEHLLTSAEDGATAITKTIFGQAMRAYYKVIKDCPMADDLKVSGSNSLREAKVDEVLGLLEGPVREDTMKVMRIKARAISDGTEGWLTVTGNEGTVYLQEVGRLFKILRDVSLTDSCDLPAESQAEDKRLRQCTVVEVMEWPKKNEESGLVRMKVQELVEGAVGWITQVDKDGVIHANPL